MSLAILNHACVRCLSTRAQAAGRKALLDRIVRVDHAGEFGATRIYEGQIAVLGKTEVGPILEEMKLQEDVHLKKFEELIPELRVRPTVMLPLWNVAGFALGAGTALLGKEAAMACTVAVEEVIGNHYDDQIRDLMADDPEVHKELMVNLKTFRDEELEHLETGLRNDAEQAPFYKALTEVIKVGCRGAVWISERV